MKFYFLKVSDVFDNCEFFFLLSWEVNIATQIPKMLSYILTREDSYWPGACMGLDVGCSSYCKLSVTPGIFKLSCKFKMDTFREVGFVMD